MLIWFALLTLSFDARAMVIREDIGELKIHDLLIRPNFVLAEPKKGSFSIGESSFAVRWELEEKFTGVIRLGPRTLINQLSHYSATLDDDFALVEAFGEYNAWYGRFRFGMLPVEFGLEGRLWERNLIFPRSLLFQKRAMMVRDVGTSWEIKQDRFMTGFVVHDGNSTGNVAGPMWLTSRFGYQLEDVGFGFTGQTGLTHAAQTMISQDTLAGVDPTKDAKWRIGGVYFDLLQRSWAIVGEYNIGSVEQEGNGRNYYAGHLDAGVLWTKRFQTYVRMDVFDPNSDNTGDLEQQLSIGLVLSNESRSSNLILIGTQALDEAPTSPGSSLRLIWSLSPSGVVRF
jgi:hypothetical protein